jgi:hypothetical protein
MNSKLLIVFVALLFITIGCDYFEGGDTQDISSIEVNIFGLPAIPDTMTFVGWFGSEDYPAYKVFVDSTAANGNILYKSDKPLESLHRAQEFILTVERKAIVNNSNLVPSTRKLLAGRFSNLASNLSIGETASNFNNVVARFNLVTPTNGTGTDELSGIWFLDSLNTPVAGLKLPELYSAWIYEGWVEINGKLVSTGRFTDPKAADLFSAYGGALAGYNFPGEDFLTNAPSGLTFPTNLSNAKVYVSMEYKDGRNSGTNPFLIIFESTIPAAAQNGVSYSMQNSSNVITGGSALMTIDLVK